MCYSGKCKYEIIGGDYWGDCSLPRRDYQHPRYPEDALCSLSEAAIEEAEREEALGELAGLEKDS